MMGTEAVTEEEAAAEEARALRKILSGRRTGWFIFLQGGDVIRHESGG